jgi:hypothetical protein
VKKSTIERIVASVPLNRTAAAVVNEREGTHWTPEIDPNIPHFATPPPMRPIPPDMESLVGRQFDRLTVVGLSVPRKSRHPWAQWVCRCTCGYYELRRGKALLDHKGREPQMCARCQALVSARWRYENLPARDFKEPLTHERAESPHPMTEEKRN